jgi:hypothetical protein
MYYLSLANRKGQKKWFISKADTGAVFRTVVFDNILPSVDQLSKLANFRSRQPLYECKHMLFIILFAMLFIILFAMLRRDKFILFNSNVMDYREGHLLLGNEGNSQRVYYQRSEYALFH